jgi:hypothetical protein
MHRLVTRVFTLRRALSQIEQRLRASPDGIKISEVIPDCIYVA